MSAVSNVWIIFNGQKIQAKYDQASGKYIATAVAPSRSSWNEPGHVFPVSIHAVDAAGNESQMDSSDSTYGNELKIRVLEKTKPIVEITSPTSGSVLGSATQDISVRMKDQGGSGLNEASVRFSINGHEYQDNLKFTDSEDGYRVATFTARNLSDGINTINFSVTDNDGNKSDDATSQFSISTAAPTLEVKTPANGIITNNPIVSVTGSTSPGTNVVTIASVKVNDTSVQLVGDSATKTFSQNITLQGGQNTITIVSTDSLGKTTTVTRVVTLDTKAPIISDVKADATTVDSGGTIRITFKVTD